jgi:hypothetical protein
MAEINGTTVSQFILSAGLLVGMLYLVNRGAGIVSTMTAPVPPVADVPAIPMMAIPGVSTDTAAMMLNQPQGRNNSVAPAMNNGDAGGLLFDDQSFFVSIAPVLPEYFANIASVRV